jgi:hypothetical protein
MWGAHQGICLQGAGYQICRSPSRRVLRGLSARQKNLALATGATYELYSEANYSFNAKGLDSQAAEPRSPRPRSPAKTSGPWRKLAEMNGSRFHCFNEQVWPHQGAEGDLHDRASSSLDLMPPARVIAGPRALLTSILLVTRVPCRGSGAGGRTLAHKQRLAAVGRSQVPPARLTHRAPTLHRPGPMTRRQELS